MFEHDDDQLPDVGKGRRLVNIISLLVPAKQYKLSCSWTTERPLPAIEEFACRLVLLFDGVTPFEIGRYFGLSQVELDGLLGNLQNKRLVELDPEGLVQPSSVLRTKSRNAEGAPSLTTYETREETAVFDLLTLSIMPRRSYRGTKHGLPEVPPPADFGSISADDIAHQFGRQYRAHLENTRTKPYERHKTRLYKVSHCRQDRTVQIPIDMEISMEVVPGEGLQLYRDAVERVGEVRKHALSNELEAQIADFLGRQEVPSDGFSFQDFQEAIGDEVLAKYCRADTLDLAAWLRDYGRSGTGYGSSETRRLAGPLYLPQNEKAVRRVLGEALRERNSDNANAYWYAAHVPLWAANGPGLADFVGRFERMLCRDQGTNGHLVTLFNTRDVSEKKSVKKTYHARLPHGVSLWGNLLRDRVELLVVPGVLAVAQYHVQPSSTSSVTIPIGQLTTDPVRVNRIEHLLHERVKPAWNSEIVWSNTNATAEQLLGEELFNLVGTEAPGAARSGSDDKQTPVVRWKRRTKAPQ